MTIIIDRNAYDQAHQVARGRYQHRIINGAETLSGSSVQDTTGKFLISRRALMRGIREKGIPFHIVTYGAQEKVLVFGSAPDSRIIVVDTHTSVPEGVNCCPTGFRVMFLIVDEVKVDALTQWCRKEWGAQGPNGRWCMPMRPIIWVRTLADAMFFTMTHEAAPAV